MASKVYQYAMAKVTDFNNNDFIVSNIDLGAGNIPGTDEAGNAYDGTKFAVACKRFLTDGKTTEELDAEIKERFGNDCSLQYALDGFLTQIMTRPNYKAHAEEAIKAQDFDRAQELAQELLDNYEVGRRKAAGANQKAQVAELNSLKGQAAALGLSMEDLMAAAAKLKAQE